ncbi:MAG: MmcQ/YjbR family DNA-binding protein [Longimicrobiales bacterium]
MVHGGQKPSPHEQKLIERITKATAGLAGVTREVDGFGHNSFRVGKKSFVIIGSGEGAGSLSIKCDLTTQDALIRGGRYVRTPYIGQHGWVTTMGNAKLDWAEIQELVEDAYRMTAPKKLLKADRPRGQ